MMQFVLLAGYPWAPFHPFMSSFVFHILYWLTFATAIYAITCYIMFFQDAKRRGVMEEHTVHVALSLVLLILTLFKFSAMLCVLPGLIVGTIRYPLVFFEGYKEYKAKISKFWDNKIALFWIVLILILIIVYQLMKLWACMMFDYKIVRFLFSVFFMAVNFVLLVLLGMQINTCPYCHYYCKLETKTTNHLGTTYGQDVTTVNTHEHHHHIEEYGKLKHYYKDTTSRETDHFRVDHYRYTCFCPHCHRTWDGQYTTKKYFKRVTENLSSKIYHDGTTYFDRYD